MADPTDDSRLQHFIGPFVAILVLLLSFTEGFERAELLSYDYRFITSQPGFWSTRYGS